MSRVPQTILVVDDEESDLSTIRDHLVENGYTLLTASDGLAAIRIYREHRAPIALLISDVAMNPMGGVELAHTLRDLQKDLKVLFISGYAGAEVLRRIESLETAAFLPKPIERDALLRKVREFLASGLTLTAGQMASTPEGATGSGNTPLA